MNAGNERLRTAAHLQYAIETWVRDKMLASPAQVPESGAGLSLFLTWTQSVDPNADPVTYRVEISQDPPSRPRVRWSATG